MHAAARREKRGRQPEEKKEPVSGLQSRAWSFACLGRFARRTKKKERLLVVLHLSPFLLFPLPLPVPLPPPPPIHPASRFGPIPSPHICDIPRRTYHVIDSLHRGVLMASSALLIEIVSLKVPVRKNLQQGSAFGSVQGYLSSLSRTSPSWSRPTHSGKLLKNCEGICFNQSTAATQIWVATRSLRHFVWKSLMETDRVVVSRNVGCFL